MKKYFFVFFTFSFLFVNAQITKGNWLVGGNGTFSSTKSKNSSIGNTDLKYLKITPKIGYFIADKFAVGFLGLLDHQKTTFGTSPSTKTTNFSVGPFVRYYFLSVDQQVNLFAEAEYFHQIFNPGKENSNGYSIAAGPAIYFNNSVGLEFTIGYSLNKYSHQELTYNTLQFGLGFQIHLERDK